MALFPWHRINDWVMIKDGETRFVSFVEYHHLSAQGWELEPDFARRVQLAEEQFYAKQLATHQTAKASGNLSSIELPELPQADPAPPPARRMVRDENGGAMVPEGSWFEAEVGWHFPETK